VTSTHYLDESPPYFFDINESKQKGNFVSMFEKYLNRLRGDITQFRVKLNEKTIVFKDWAGFYYWQHPDDPIALNFRRRSVTDGNHIIQYIINNVETGWTCIDIGANIGAISVPLWSKVGFLGKVFSIEPHPNNFAKLKKNLLLNGFSEEYVLGIAISKNEETVKLRCYPENPGWHTLGDPLFSEDIESYFIDVPCLGFQKLLDRLDIEAVDLVKIDVEGAELSVLEGMRDLLAHKKIGSVIFEVNHLMLEGFSCTEAELFDFWDDFNYELYYLSENGVPHEIYKGWQTGFIGDCIAFPQ